MVNRTAVIIIPVYNEGSVISKVVKEVSKHFRYVVCVSDGSIDSSAAEINKTSAYLVEHPINLGQGAALQTGIEFAEQLPVDYFVTFDADGQHRVADVKRMLAHAKASGVDVVLGSRFLGTPNYIGRWKKVLLKLAVWFTNLTTGTKLTDTHNGLRVLNRKAAALMQLQASDFSHASEIIERITDNDLTYAELPVTIIYNDYSRAKGQSMINAINIGFDVLVNRMLKK